MWAVGGPRSNNENDIPHIKMGGTSRRVADKRFCGALTGQQQNTFEGHERDQNYDWIRWADRKADHGE
jgi:hypothetical protein